MSFSFKEKEKELTGKVVRASKGKFMEVDKWSPCKIVRRSGNSGNLLSVELTNTEG